MYLTMSYLTFEKIHSLKLEQGGFYELPIYRRKWRSNRNRRK